MSQHPITITGHLTQDPRTIRLKSGQLKTVVRVASSRRVRDIKPGGDGEQNSQASVSEPAWKDIDLLFMDIEVWGQFAANVRKSLHKGMPIIALGSLMTNQWEDAQGQPQSRTIMRANFLGLDLARYAVASKKNDAIYNEAGIEDPGFESNDFDCKIDEDHLNPAFDDRRRSEDARAGLGLGMGTDGGPAGGPAGELERGEPGRGEPGRGESEREIKEKAMV